VDFEGFSDRISLVGERNISGLIYKMIQGYREQKRVLGLASTGGMLQTFIITVIQRITQKGAG
jgi:multisubunit Na+/H+ antiporter MnhF subunit